MANFLSLPREVRENIYGSLFSGVHVKPNLSNPSKYHLRVRKRRKLQGTGGSLDPSVPGIVSILLTCRLVHLEARSKFYSVIVFDLTTLRDPCQLPRAFPDFSFLLVRNICLDLCINEEKRHRHWETLFRTFHSIRSTFPLLEDISFFWAPVECFPLHEVQQATNLAAFKSQMSNSVPGFASGLIRWVHHCVKELVFHMQSWNRAPRYTIRMRFPEWDAQDGLVVCNLVLYLT